MVGLARAGRRCRVGERAGGYPKGWVGSREVGGNCPCMNRCEQDSGGNPATSSLGVPAPPPACHALVVVVANAAPHCGCAASRPLLGCNVAC